MSKGLCELCTLLVEEYAGSLPATIFSILITHGSISLPQVVQLSNLLPRFVKNALALLIQRRLVKYSDVIDDDKVYYEANIQSAYGLIRAGKHSQILEKNISKHASNIVLELQQRGFVAASDLTKIAWECKDAVDTTTVENLSDRNGSSLAAYLAPVQLMISSNHVVRANLRDVQSLQSILQKTEAEVAAEDFPNGFRDVKERKQFENEVRMRIKRQRRANIAQPYDLLEWVDDRSTQGTVQNDSVTQMDPIQPKLLNGNLEDLQQPTLNGYAEIESPRKRRRTKLEIESENLHELEEDLEGEKPQPRTHRTRWNAKHPKEMEEKDRNKVVDRSKAEGKAAATKGRKRTNSESEGTDGSDVANEGSKIFKRRKLNGGDRQATTQTKFVKNLEKNAGVDKLELTNGHESDTQRHNLSDQKPVSIIENQRISGFDKPVPGQRKSDPVLGSKDCLVDSSKEPYFRLNLEKFDVSHRNQILVEFCLKSLGEPTSKVYAALLHCLESRLKRCSEKDDDNSEANDNDVDDHGSDEEDSTSSYSIPTDEIARSLDPRIELYAETRRPKENREETIATDLSRDKPSRGFEQEITRDEEVEHHLQILAEHEDGFVEPVLLHDQQRWTVEFPRVVLILIQRELENIVHTRFDGFSARIVRILYSKGKLEEKHLAEAALIKQKEIRSKLAIMQEAGFLDVQEVPRDASRQPSRTIYLWFFDQDRLRRHVLDNAYQMMSRLLQRASFERSKLQSVLNKAARTDVIGREEELLHEEERAALRELERKEDRIWIQISRLDDMVALLRDFYVKHRHNDRGANNNIDKE